MDRKDRIQFKYKGDRIVILLIEDCSENHVGGFLETNYFGKNVDWYCGEYKSFNISEMRDIKKLNSSLPASPAQ